MVGSTPQRLRKENCEFQDLAENKWPASKQNPR